MSGPNMQISDCPPKPPTLTANQGSTHGTLRTSAQIGTRDSNPGPQTHCIPSPGLQFTAQTFQRPNTKTLSSGQIQGQRPGPWPSARWET